MVPAGRHVKIHYIGTLEDGTEFDNSYKRGEPLEFVMGSRKVLGGIEDLVNTLGVGTKGHVHILAGSAFGAYNEDLIDRIPKASVSNADKLPVGNYVMLKGEGGRPVRAKIVSVGDDEIVLDYNHPLAGHDIDFEVELVDVEEPDAIEEEKHPVECDCHRVQHSLEHAHDQAHADCNH
jgi:FKBP-type peptidyl-prolyl cis-trans isomerase 2